MDEGLIEMSGKERDRQRVMEAVVDKRMRQAEAAKRLGLSVRQIKRLVQGYRSEGARALVSKRRGQPSNRRIGDAQRTHYVALVRAQYGDFGPRLAAEYLRERHGYMHSDETLRQWLMQAGQWQAKAARAVKLHPPRARRPRVGELVQIDGSAHDWFEARGPKCTLIAFIDDASSQVMAARLVPIESTAAYLEVLQGYVSEHGVPLAIYSDRHGIFRKHDPEDQAPTQFQRALKQLSIRGFQALSPQAKGRVERLFQTLQDRLVKALRLAHIDTLAAANAFLPSYLEQHNARFAVAPAQPEDAHHGYEDSAEALARICAHQHMRKLSKELVLSFQGRRYLLNTGGAPRYALSAQPVTVVQYADGRIELMHGSESLAYRVLDMHGPIQSAATVIDAKTLNAQIDGLLNAQQLKAQRPRIKPAANHPWRRVQAGS